MVRPLRDCPSFEDKRRKNIRNSLTYGQTATKPRIRKLPLTKNNSQQSAKTPSLNSRKFLQIGRLIQPAYATRQAYRVVLLVRILGGRLFFYFNTRRYYKSPAIMRTKL